MASALRERLARQGPLLGFLQTHPNAAVAEMAAVCGYDFVLLDGEYGEFTDRDYVRTLQTLAPTRALSLVRLANQDPQGLARYVHLGADAIVVPDVSTVEQARALAHAMGCCSAGGRDSETPMRRASAVGTLLLPIIESALGVSHVEEILAVEGVDGVFIGPWDLTADLGFSGDFSQPAYARAAAQIEHAAKAREKILGTAPHPGHSLDMLVARGHRLLVLDDDLSIMRGAMTAQVANARTGIETSQTFRSS